MLTPLIATATLAAASLVAVPPPEVNQYQFSISLDDAAFIGEENLNFIEDALGMAGAELVIQPMQFDPDWRPRFTPFVAKCMDQWCIGDGDWHPLWDAECYRDYIERCCRLCPAPQ